MKQIRNNTKQAFIEYVKSKHPTIKEESLKISGPIVDLSGVELGAEGMKLLADMLSDDGGVIKLNLDHALIRDGGIEGLMRIVSSNPIINLNLRDNGLTAKGAEQLITMLDNNRTLTTISLHDSGRIDSRKHSKVGDLTSRNAELVQKLAHFIAKNFAGNALPPELAIKDFDALRFYQIADRELLKEDVNDLLANESDANSVIFGRDADNIIKVRVNNDKALKISSSQSKDLNSLIAEFNKLKVQEATDFNVLYNGLKNFNKLIALNGKDNIFTVKLFNQFTDDQTLKLVVNKFEGLSSKVERYIATNYLKLKGVCKDIQNSECHPALKDNNITSYLFTFLEDAGLHSMNEFAEDIVEISGGVISEGSAGEVI